MPSEEPLCKIFRVKEGVVSEEVGMVPHDPVDVTLVQFLGIWDIMHHPSEDGKVVFCVEVGAVAGYKGEAGELLPLHVYQLLWQSDF